MTIGVYVNEQKDAGLTVANKIAGAILARGGTAVIATSTPVSACGTPCAVIETPVCASDAFGGCDIIICIGGDGTLIKAARETLACGAALLGVNMGSLGYLTEVETSQIDAILDRIFAKVYRVEERMMLKITKTRAAPANGRSHTDAQTLVDEQSHVDGWSHADAQTLVDGQSYADGQAYSDELARRDSGAAADSDPCHVETVLNELYIGRGDSPHVVRLKLYVNGSFYDVYSGDGILISTPTGSTAYALSAGGPIIDPELSVISIVPVCPHVIFSRPLLVSPDKIITIEPVCVDGAFKASISVDGYNIPDFREGEIIQVQKAEYLTKILRFNAENFYVVLKNKLFQTSGKFGPEPRGSEPGLESERSEPGPEPRGSEPGPEPRESESGPEPCGSEPGPEPRGSERGPEPCGSEPGPEPRKSEPGPEPRESELGSEPRESGTDSNLHGSNRAEAPAYG